MSGHEYLATKQDCSGHSLQVSSGWVLAGALGTKPGAGTSGDTVGHHPLQPEGWTFSLAQ